LALREQELLPPKVQQPAIIYALLAEAIGVFSSEKKISLFEELSAHPDIFT
jgi:hypothetical protein